MYVVLYNNRGGDQSMSSAILPPPIAPSVPTCAPQPARWTCEEFHQIGDEGWFEHKRAILIDGEILDMPVPNPPHSTAKDLAQEVLRRIFDSKFVVRTENPLVLARSTDPVPDLAVVTGSIRDYTQSRPTTAL
jgi:Uma2 family endonuclease